MESEAITSLLQRVIEAPSEFYRRRLAAVGIDSASAADAAALARLPLTQREELVRDQLAHLPSGSRRFADAGHAVRTGMTGSGDALLVLIWSAADLARERRAGARLFGRLGVTAGMRVANTLPGALATPGALLIGDVIEERGALDVPLGSIENDAAAGQAWELIDRVQPTVLLLEPASAARLFAAAPGAARSWWQGILWMRTDGAPVATPLPPPSAGFEGWQRSWLAVPEATSFVAHSCSAARFHLDEAVGAEVVDDTTGVLLAPGSEGILALTPSGLDTPVLRYATRFRARATEEPCPCGVARPSIQIQ